MRLTQYDDLLLHEIILNNLQQMVFAAINAVEESQIARDKIYKHNNDESAHADIHKLLSDFIGNKISVDDIVSLIKKHDSNPTSHLSLFNKLRSVLMETQNNWQILQQHLDTLKQNIEKSIEKRDINDNKLTELLATIKQKAFDALDNHNTSTLAHNTLFKDLYTKNSNIYINQSANIDNHNIDKTAHQNIRTDFTNKINNIQSQIDESVLLTKDQTIQGSKIFEANTQTNKNLVGTRFTCLDANIAFANKDGFVAYIDGNSMQDNTWKRIALYEDVQNLSNVMVNSIQSQSTNAAAAWSRDRQMVPDGTRWAFSPDVTYTAPRNGFIRLEDFTSDIYLAGRWTAVFVIYINGGVAARVHGAQIDAMSNWDGGYMNGTHKFLSYLYPIRTGWTWRVGREVGDSWPSYMEYIQCYF